MWPCLFGILFNSFPSFSPFFFAAQLQFFLSICLRSLPKPSFALSPIEFESFMRALTSTPVSADFKQSDLRPGEPILAITGLTTRVFRSPLLLTTPPRAFPRPLLWRTLRVLEYSDDSVFLFHPPHLVYHLPAPLPDNSIIIGTVVNICILLFM